MWSKLYTTSLFYKVSDNFIVSLISKNGCSTVALLAQCYNENLDINEFNRAETCHLMMRYPTVFRHIQSNYKINYDTHNGPEKIVAIFRDPIERYKSIFFTPCVVHLNRFDFHENLIQLSKTDRLSQDNPLYLDHHYIPQYVYYDFDKIDIFVELKDYKMFCQEHNIPWVMANKNINDNYTNFSISKEDQDIIKKLYQKDYELINKIRQSNKLYIPNK